MKERPIIFNSEMIRAILDGKKSMTRRIVKPQPPSPDECIETIPCGIDWDHVRSQCPYGQAGGLLWVREEWRFLGTNMNRLGRTHSQQDGIFEYRADGSKNDMLARPWQDIENLMKTKHGDRWRRAIHMYKWVSRITLEIVSVKVERVQDISRNDIVCEGTGMAPTPKGCSRVAEFGVTKEDFRYLWDSLNSKKGFGWDVNPFCWVVEFKKL